MDSDIKLEGNRLHLEADFILARSCDIILDCPSRNKGKGAPTRRALVHDFNDGLTINWASDYPGGVTINGDLTVEKKEVKPGTGVVIVDIGPDGRPRRRNVPVEYIRTPVVLSQVLAELTGRIAELEKKLAEIEAKK